MIRPGLLAIDVEPRPDGGADLVGDGLYYVVRYLRAQARPRRSMEATLERLLFEAMATEARCAACDAVTRHVPVSGPDHLQRCSACTAIRQDRPRVRQPSAPGSQLLLFELPAPVAVARLERRPRRRVEPGDQLRLALPRAWELAA